LAEKQKQIFVTYIIIVTLTTVLLNVFTEEMYAAIDDPIDGNYMRIPGEDGHPRRPNWIGILLFF